MRALPSSGVKTASGSGSIYREEGVRVAMSGMLIERSFPDGGSDKALARAKSLGFDMVEVSDGIIEISASEKRAPRSQGQDCWSNVLYTVGKKDPPARFTERDSGPDPVGTTLGPFKVVIESRERGRG